MAVLKNVLQDVVFSSGGFDPLVVRMRYPHRKDDSLRQVRSSYEDCLEVLVPYKDRGHAACADRLLKLSNPGHQPLAQQHLNTIYAYECDSNGRDNFFGKDHLELVYAYGNLVTFLNIPRSNYCIV